MKALARHLKKQTKKLAAVWYDGDQFRAITSYIGVNFTPHPDDKITLEKLFVELWHHRNAVIKNDWYVSVGRGLSPEDMDVFFRQKIAELGKAEKAVLTQNLIDDRHHKDVDGNPQIWKIVTTDTRTKMIPLAQYDIIPETIGYNAEVYLTDGAVPTVVVQGKTKKEDMVVIAVRGDIH